MNITSFLKTVVGFKNTNATRPTSADLRARLQGAKERVHDAHEHYLNEVYGGASEPEIYDAKRQVSRAKREVVSLGKQLKVALKRESKAGAPALSYAYNAYNVYTAAAPAETLDSASAPPLSAPPKPAAGPRPDAARVTHESIVRAHEKAAASYRRHAPNEVPAATPTSSAGRTVRFVLLDDE